MTSTLPASTSGARPSTLAEGDYKVADLSLAEFGRKPLLIAQGKARREYRDHRLDWMMRSGGKDIVARGIESDILKT